MNTRGFTLIEIIVSLGIFAVVAVIAIGALLKIVDANKKAQSIQSAMTNLNYALESMSREMRVGSGYHCDTNYSGGGFPTSGMSAQACTPGQGKLIAFRSSKFDPTNDPMDPCYNIQLIFAYAFVPDGAGNFTMEKAQQNRCTDTIGSDAPFSPVISIADVTITGFNLGVLYEATNQKYPLAFVSVNGYAGVREQSRTYFQVQTSVSNRLQ